MSPAVKLGAFGLVLGLALGGGALVGRAVGPIDDDPRPDAVAEADADGQGEGVGADSGKADTGAHGGGTQGVGHGEAP
ncbi:MAG TPA: hypothetical protein VF015_07335 [Acidimicrobiales bacterium]